MPARIKKLQSPSVLVHFDHRHHAEIQRLRRQVTDSLEVLQVLQVVADGGEKGVTRAQVGDRLSWSPHPAMLGKMVEGGWLRRKGRGRAALYFILAVERRSDESPQDHEADPLEAMMRTACIGFAQGIRIASEVAGLSAENRESLADYVGSCKSHDEAAAALRIFLEGEEVAK